MPKSNRHIISKLPLSRSRNYPYAQRTNVLRTPNPRTMDGSAIVPFDEIRVGRFYNCTVLFKPIKAGGRVPGMIPRHRVLVSRIQDEAGKQEVEMFYITTFGGKTPTLFHGARDKQCKMYLPLEPQTLAGYITLSSRPPLMCGWLNFARPALLTYSAHLLGARKIRHAPESTGVGVPLRHGPIDIAPWALNYVQEMKHAWNMTMDCTTTPARVEQWPGRANELYLKFSMRREEEKRSGPRGVAEDPDDNTEAEWMGITGLLDGVDDDDHNNVEDEEFDLGKVGRSLVEPGFSTPLRVSAAPLPTPSGSGRHSLPFPSTPRQALVPFPALLPTPPACALATHSEYEFELNHAGLNNPAEAKKSSESEQLSQFRLHRGRGKESPVYDDYRAIASFWEIAEGEHADIEDPPEDLYSKVVLGRPWLTL